MKKLQFNIDEVFYQSLGTKKMQVLKDKVQGLIDRVLLSSVVVGRSGCLVDNPPCQCDPTVCQCDPAGICRCYVPPCYCDK